MIRKRGEMMKRRIDIVTDLENRKIVVIHDVIFRGRQNIEWDEIKEYLKEFVGKSFIIDSVDEMIYMGVDLPLEYAGSNDTFSLKGQRAKAKANAVQGLPEMIMIAWNRSYKENHESKHRQDAKYGWYRYDTRFALPVYDEDGEVIRYNVFHAYLIIRHAADKKLYLYDLINVKKEPGNPFMSEDLLGT
jgi:hypothetical protein